MSLTDMQKRYLWLAGSYPNRVLVQGQGKRSRRLKYALSGDDEIVVFGYSNPPMWLVGRGLMKTMQARHTYALTAEGDEAFQKILCSGGIDSREFEETRVRPRETD